MLKIYLVSRNAYSWLEDYKMVVIAEDEEEAKTIARKTSLDFAHDNNIGVEEVDTSKKQCILTCNTGT